MKTTTKSIEKQIQKLRIDSSLEKYLTMPIFQDKVDKVNEVIEKYGLPKVSIKE